MTRSVGVMLLFVLLVAGGCCKPCEPVAPLVTTCTAPPRDAYVHPTLPLSELRGDVSASEVMQAYVLSVKILQGHISYLENLLHGYDK